MSTDFNLMCEYKETKDFKWEAYKNPNGTVWDSKFWGISCIKRAFMSKNGHNNNQEKFSKGVEDLYGHYRQLSIVDNLSFDFEYLNSDEMIILSEFEELNSKTVMFMPLNTPTNSIKPLPSKSKVEVIITS